MSKRLNLLKTRPIPSWRGPQEITWTVAFCHEGNMYVIPSHLKPLFEDDYGEDDLHDKWEDHLWMGDLHFENPTSTAR